MRLQKKRKELMEKIEQINTSLDNITFADYDPDSAEASQANKPAHV